jgi:hypothetical protein
MAKEKTHLVEASEVAAALPEYFGDRWQVLRLAKRRTIPCYALPGSGRTRNVELRFRIKDVRKAMEGYFQPAC